MSQVELEVQPIVDGVIEHVKEIAGQQLIFLTDKTRILKGYGKNEGKFKVYMYTTADFELGITVDVYEAFRNPNYFDEMIPNIRDAVDEYLEAYQKWQSMAY